MGRRRCEVCGEGDVAQLGSFVAPCLCHKKSDDHGYYHTLCLEDRLRQPTADPDGTPTTRTCERCGAPFRVKVEEEVVWDLAHVCRARVLGHCFEVRRPRRRQISVCPCARAGADEDVLCADLHACDCDCVFRACV